MPAQDRIRGDQAMAAQCSRQPPEQGGENSPVRPAQAWSWVAAAQYGDLVPQHEQFDVFGGGSTAAQQQDQPQHLQEEQIQQPQRHNDDHARPSKATDHRCSAACATFWNPTGSHTGRGGSPAGALRAGPTRRARGDREGGPLPEGVDHRGGTRAPARKSGHGAGVIRRGRPRRSFRRRGGRSPTVGRGSRRAAAHGRVRRARRRAGAPDR